MIHPGIDHYPKKSLCDVRKLFGIEGTLVVYQGRASDTSPYKNTDGLLRMVKDAQRVNPDIQLLLSVSCGYEAQAEFERQGVFALNSVTVDFVPSIYASSDIFATASQWEGFDLPLLEASYFGLPVVAFDVGAHPEIVKHGRTGFLARNEEDFVGYLVKLAESPGLRAEFGSGGRRFAKSNFLWRKAVDQYAHILENLH